MNFIDRCVLPGLRRGKLPSEYDQKMLFLGSQRDQGLSVVATPTVRRERQRTAIENVGKLVRSIRS
jgi:hypothetical protein